MRCIGRNQHVIQELESTIRRDHIGDVFVFRVHLQTVTTPSIGDPRSFAHHQVNRAVCGKLYNIRRDGAQELDCFVNFFLLCGVRAVAEFQQHRTKNIAHVIGHRDFALVLRVCQLLPADGGTAEVLLVYGKGDGAVGIGDMVFHLFIEVATTKVVADIFDVRDGRSIDLKRGALAAHLIDNIIRYDNHIVHAGIGFHAGKSLFITLDKLVGDLCPGLFFKITDGIRANVVIPREHSELFLSGIDDHGDNDGNCRKRQKEKNLFHKDVEGNTVPYFKSYLKKYEEHSYTPFMRPVASSLRVLHIGFWILSILLLAVILVVPFLQIDRNFNVSPSLSLSGVVGTWDTALLSALWNSVVLSIFASLFAILCGGLLREVIEKRPLWLFLVMIVVYAVNPVARALSYFDLFQLYTPIAEWSNALLGRKFSTTIILPSLILGIHYLPVYLMRNLFVLKKRVTAHDLPPVLETIFDDIPVWARGFPISFALFFLLSFFDYWVINVISGNTVLYWTPLFVQKGFEARAVSQAALMIVIGLLVTVFAYLAALIVSMAIRALIRQLRPLWFATLKGSSKGMIVTGRVLATLTILFICWPIIGMVIDLVTLLMSGGSFEPMTGTSRGLLVMLSLGLAIALTSATLGLILSAVYQEYPRRYTWWLPALYLLALMPEAAYVLFSLFVTGAGFIRGNPLWLFFLMASFSIPIAFFLWESLWGESEKQKLWMLGSALNRQPELAFKTAFREWQRPWSIVFVVVFWLTIDNVFITDFSAGPSWKPLSAVIFNATKRGFSDQELVASLIGTLCVLAVIGVTLGLCFRKRSE